MLTAEMGFSEVDVGIFSAGLFDQLGYRNLKV
jgi:hypothetical protein